jgi:hypothetical protein
MMSAGRLSDLLYISRAVFAITDCVLLGQGMMVFLWIFTNHSGT